MKTTAEEIYASPSGVCASLTVEGDSINGYTLELHVPPDTQSLSIEFLEDCVRAITSHVAGAA